MKSFRFKISGEAMGGNRVLSTLTVIGSGIGPDWTDRDDAIIMARTLLAPNVKIVAVEEVDPSGLETGAPTLADNRCLTFDRSRDCRGI